MAGDSSNVDPVFLQVHSKRDTDKYSNAVVNFIVGVALKYSSLDLLTLIKEKSPEYIRAKPRNRRLRY